MADQIVEIFIQLTFYVGMPTVEDAYLAPSTESTTAITTFFRA